MDSNFDCIGLVGAGVELGHQPLESIPVFIIETKEKRLGIIFLGSSFGDVGCLAARKVRKCSSQCFIFVAEGIFVFPLVADIRLVWFAAPIFSLLGFHAARICSLVHRGFPCEDFPALSPFVGKIPGFSPSIQEWDEGTWR